MAVEYKFYYPSPHKSQLVNGHWDRTLSYVWAGVSFTQRSIASNAVKTEQRRYLSIIHPNIFRIFD